MDEKEWVVGIAETKVSQSPDRLVAYGLGSCVAVTLFDTRLKCGGLAHIMLPSSELSTRTFLPGKYADSAIDLLFLEMKAMGSRRQDLESKLVGGANMFKTIISHSVPIGIRNSMAAREKLKQISIPVLGEDLGGESGRTIVFSLMDGRIKIRKVNKPEFWL